MYSGVISFYLFTTVLLSTLKCIKRSSTEIPTIYTNVRVPTTINVIVLKVLPRNTSDVVCFGMQRT